MGYVPRNRSWFLYLYVRRDAVAVLPVPVKLLHVDEAMSDEFQKAEAGPSRFREWDAVVTRSTLLTKTQSLTKARTLIAHLCARRNPLRASAASLPFEAVRAQHWNVGDSTKVPLGNLARGVTYFPDKRPATSRQGQWAH